MKNTKLLLLLMPLLGIALQACKKDDAEIIAPIAPGNYEVYTVLKNHAAKPETFTINATQPNPITTAYGTILNINSNSLRYLDGSVVTGNVNVSVNEIHSKKQMIYNNAATVSNGELIASEGELFIDVTSNGLPLKPASTYLIRIPSTNTIPSMPLFVGQYTGVDSLAQSLNWVVDTFNFFKNAGYYRSWSSRFGWINCDYFYNNPNPKGPLTAILPAGYDLTNTCCYLSIDNANTIGNMMAGNTIPNSFIFNQLPMGSYVHIITVTVSDGKMYYSSTPVVMSENLQVTITPTEINEADLDALLDAIP